MTLRKTKCTKLSKTELDTKQKQIQLAQMKFLRAIKGYTRRHNTKVIMEIS
jgi:hypothetical protein